MNASPRRLFWSRPALVMAGLAVCGIFSTGCQVEYAGMTLPSGKYMLDDVQYFAHGPSFGWANTQAATQRARMQAMGMEVSEPGQASPPNPLGSAPTPGMAPPGSMGPDQGVPPGQGVVPNVPVPAPPAPGNVPPAGNPGGVPAPPAAAPPDAASGSNGH
jgi:hypothetical protein